MVTLPFFAFVLGAMAAYGSFGIPFLWIAIHGRLRERKRRKAALNRLLAETAITELERME